MQMAKDQNDRRMWRPPSEKTSLTGWEIRNLAVTNRKCHLRSPYLVQVFDMLAQKVPEIEVEAPSTAMLDGFSWIWLMTCRQTYVCAHYDGRS